MIQPTTQTLLDLSKARRKTAVTSHFKTITQICVSENFHAMYENADF